MIETKLHEILQNNNVRQALSTLRQEIKDSYAKEKLQILIPDHMPTFIALLEHPDAKTRKNVALLMGDLVNYDFLEPLYEAYTKESQMFVKSAYLTALSAYDCSIFLEDLKERLNMLTKTATTEETKKHIDEEIRSLTKLLIQEEGIEPHHFNGFHHKYDCILLTNRLHKEITQQQITKGEFRPFLPGVRVLTEEIEELLPIRTYSELLFVIPGLTTVPMEAVSCAKMLIHSNLLSLLKASHREAGPFYFRIEIKSKMPLDEKSAFAKKVTSEIQSQSDRQLINSTSNYEIELRLIENKNKTFNVLLKLHTLKDERFDYRKESVAASIKPVNAALLVELAKEYMIEDARILDPFCGVGTLLIERQKVMKGNTSYGIDLYAPAIEKAKINTAAANQIIHYINRDFFDFTHEHKFDEIFTNMPFAMGHKGEVEIQSIYKNFFPKAKECLTNNGTIIMYSHNKDYVENLAEEFNYQIKKAIKVMDKEDTWLFVLRFA